MLKLIVVTVAFVFVIAGRSSWSPVISNSSSSFKGYYKYSVDDQYTYMMP